MRFTCEIQMSAHMSFRTKHSTRITKKEKEEKNSARDGGENTDKHYLHSNEREIESKREADRSEGLVYV